MFTQKRAYTPPPTPFSAFPRPFVLRRDRRQKTRNLEVNQQSRITARRLRTHEWRSRPTAEQERNITQAVLFGAQAANSRRDRTHDISRGTYDGREQTHDIPKGTHDGREQTHDIPIESHDRHRTNTAPRVSRPAPADRPPRAQSPLPELKPAKRNAATARNSRTHHPHQHIAASARNTAPRNSPSRPQP